MTDVELLCEALELNKIEDLNKELTRAGKNHSTARDVLMKEVCGFTYFFIGLLVQDPFTCMFIFIYGCVIVCLCICRCGFVYMHAKEFLECCSNFKRKNFHTEQLQ